MRRYIILKYVPNSTNFEHLIAAFVNNIHVPDGEPLAESRTDLDKSTNDNQRFLLIKRGDFRDIVLRKRLRIRRIQLEHVAGVLCEVVHLPGNCRNPRCCAAGSGMHLAPTE